jgi:hypothetical protein
LRTQKLFADNQEALEEGMEEIFLDFYKNSRINLRFRKF